MNEPLKTVSAENKPPQVVASTVLPPQTPSLLMNYFSLLGGTIGAKVLSFLSMLMLSRYLGVEDFGRYSLIFSYWALLNTLVDFGSQQIAGREISKEPAAPRIFIESAIYLRLLGCLIFLPMGFIAARFLDIPPEFALITFAGIFASFEMFYDAYFSATMQLDKSAKSRVLSSIANVILIAIAILMGLPLAVILLITLLNPLIKLACDLNLTPTFQLRLHLPDWGHIRNLARDSWPVWLLGVQYIVLARIDTFMLQVLSVNGEYELGIYAAAFRFSEIMALLVTSMTPAILPLLVARMNEPARLQVLVGTGMRLTLAVLISLSLLFFWYAPWIIKIYGAGYDQAALCMKILIWSQVLVAVNTIGYQVLVIYNAQGKWLVILSGILTTAVNIGLNLLLIPKFQAQGAALATVITEFLVVLNMLWFLRRYTPVRLGRDILMFEILALLACIPVFFLGELYGWISIVVFLAIVLGLRLLTLAEIKMLARERRDIST